MGSDDWYRNAEWNPAVSAEFEARLSRARRKEQYLRIQACTLAGSNPGVAHSLLDRYFELPDQSDAAQAHVDRATAFLAPQRIEEALQAYERALAREAEFPHMLTQAYIEFPFVVATRAIQPRIPRALEILEQHKHRLMFAVDHFKWNAAHALIASILEQPDVPYQYAKAALDAAERVHSGFQFHPKVGLVPGSLAEVQVRMRRLCDA